MKETERLRQIKIPTRSPTLGHRTTGCPPFSGSEVQPPAPRNLDPPLRDLTVSLHSVATQTLSSLVYTSRTIDH